MYSMVNHIKMYASLVSTVLESICDNMAVKKSDDLSPKSCIFTSKQPCANTRIRLLATYYSEVGKMLNILRISRI